MTRPGRRVLLVCAVALLAAAGGLALSRARSPQVRYQTAVADRGDVVSGVGATGTVQAVTTVQVGTQVSGTLLELRADFNSHVRKGDVVARLDPSLFDARLQQAKANQQSATANVERARANLEDARLRRERAESLAAQQLLAPSDLDAARAAHQSAAADVKAAEAAVQQAAATVNQADVDLSHTVIRSPIDGVVVARNVDVGQTVAASLQAPVLFVIAGDLSRMQVVTSVDEADIGRVHDGDGVTFRVDAHPERVFTGRVEQVRLQPTVAQNVVTYSAIVSAANADLVLLPGMTATVTIEAQRREGVVRVPAAALRFRPEGFADEGPRGGRPRGGEGGGADQPRTRSGDDTGRERPSGRPGVIFVPGADGPPEPKRVRVGLSDGQLTEVVEGLDAGATVIVGVEGETSRTGPRPGGSPGANNPFNPQFQRRQR